jgi:hypothetical protein
MAGARKPGPQCSYNDPVDINDGTMCLAKSPTPGPVGISPFLSVWRDQAGFGFQMTSVSNDISAEPILSQTRIDRPVDYAHSVGDLSSTQLRPANIDTLIGNVQREFPFAAIRITGRGRTVERQAELMAQRRRGNRNQFLSTYRPAAHITEMDRWVTAHPPASEAETVAAFVEIIDRARGNGAVVSNHLSDRARDISIPVGNAQYRNQVRQHLERLGAHVLDEHDATTGAHWHVDY